MGGSMSAAQRRGFREDMSASKLSEIDSYLHGVKEGKDGQQGGSGMKMPSGRRLGRSATLADVMSASTPPRGTLSLLSRSSCSADRSDSEGSVGPMGMPSAESCNLEHVTRMLTPDTVTLPEALRGRQSAQTEPLAPAAIVPQLVTPPFHAQHLSPASTGLNPIRPTSPIRSPVDDTPRAEHPFTRPRATTLNVVRATRRMRRRETAPSPTFTPAPPSLPRTASVPSHPHGLEGFDVSIFPFPTLTPPALATSCLHDGGSVSSAGDSMSLSPRPGRLRVETRLDSVCTSPTYPSSEGAGISPHTFPSPHSIRIVRLKSLAESLRTLSPNQPRSSSSLFLQSQESDTARPMSRSCRAPATNDS